jgi:hypothetical protein
VRLGPHPPRCGKETRGRRRASKARKEMIGDEKQQELKNTEIIDQLTKEVEERERTIEELTRDGIRMMVTSLSRMAKPLKKAKSLGVANH